MESLSARILDYNRDRLRRIVKWKFKAMKENPFRFYRGTTHLFYEDLSRASGLPPSPITWTCGDLHLENFGSFKSDSRQVYFDLNDFDEAILAPAVWEIFRMLTSIYIAFESLDIGMNKADHMARLYLKTYADVLTSGKADYLELNTAEGIVRDFLNAASKRKQKEVLEKKTVERRNKLEMLLDDPRHLELKKSQKRDLVEHLGIWLKNDGNSPYNYQVEDAVFRLAGTGSLGVKRYAILLKSLNQTGEKYLLLDMKAAIPPSSRPYLTIAQPDWTNEAERIVSVQRLMQNRSPALLSTTIFKDIPYIIEEIQPAKDKINFKMLKKEYRDMIRVVANMAMLTASAQLRSSGRQGSAIADELIEFGAAKDWHDKALSYCSAYAYTVREYYQIFLSDYNEGVFEGQSGKSPESEPEDIILKSSG